MRKLTVLTGLAFSFAAAAWLTGCMSMDEMLASEDGFWRDIGETQAVSFALDGANPLEKRLEVVPKIANQQKLAKIVIDRNVAPEVKAEARKRIDETTALVAIALNAPDRNDQLGALKQIRKSEDARVDAAWMLAESKPSSQAPKTLLKNLSDAGMARFAKSYVDRIDAAVAAGEEAARLKEKFGDSMASGKLKEQESILNSLVALAPCVEDEDTIAALLNRQDIADVRGSQYDFLTPLEGARSKAVARRKDRENEAFLETLTDDERAKILEEGGLTKDGRTFVVKGERNSVQTDGEICEFEREKVVKGIKDQALVAKINAAEAERKAREAEARKRTEEIKALVETSLNSPDRKDQMAAIRQIGGKGEDARIDAAWMFAERKPSSLTLNMLVKNLSDAGMDRFAKTYVDKIDEAMAAGEEGRKKEQFAILDSLVALAPYLEDEKTITAILGREEISDVKGTQYDFLTPLEGVLSRAVARRKAREEEAFLAELTDDERVKILEEGRLTKDFKTVVVKCPEDAADGKPDASGDDYEYSGSLVEATYEVEREEIIKGIKDQALAAKINAAEAERKAREEERRKKEIALKAMHGKAFDDLIKANILKEHDINHVDNDYDNRTAETKYKAAAEYVGKISYYEGMGGIKKWMKSIELFKDSPDLQQEWTEMLFENAYSGFDDEKKLVELKKVMAVMPQSRLVEILRSCITDTEVDNKARAVAYGITDQALLKNLLVDDDSWARPRRKGCYEDWRRYVHGTLLNNVKDPELADKIFFETRPTKNTEVITVNNLLRLVDRISEAKRKELTDRAIARSEEAAKTTVTVLQYYVGMSRLDYKLINYSNDSISAPGLSIFDDDVSRKMIKIGFTKADRIKKLGITENNVIGACHQFGSKYGHVPDGKDVSGKTDVVAAIRTTTAYSDYAPGGVEYSNNSVWKWIDYVHDIQAEIGTNSGNLVLCAAEIEGEFNNKDVRREQQAAAVGAYADLASDSDDEDMGPDEGLEPVGQ